MRETLRDKEGWLIKYDGVPVRRITDIPPTKRLDKLAIQLKGCNGSGKSTIPLEILHHEKTRTCYLTASQGDKKPVATFCAPYNLAVLGVYLTACGGCDSLSDTQVVKFVLSRLWKRNCHILFEGVIVGDIKSTFYDMMKAFNEVHHRHISFCFMGTKLSECLRRIQGRNGGKPIKEDLVRGKYKNSTTHLKYYLEQGDVECHVLNTTGTPVQVLQRFGDLYPQLGVL